MDFDAHLSLAEISESQESFYKEIIEIQDQILPEKSFSDCGRRLRFLRTPDITIDEMTKDLHRQRTLYLSGRDDNPDERNYLAVSYCWQSFNKIDKGSGSLTYDILSRGKMRASRAPKIVLDRAVSFAIARAIPYIWIDQECIEQDDPSEKEIMIQVMDQIFSSCKYSIGLLDTSIESQEALDEFSRLLSRIRDQSMPKDLRYNTSWYDSTEPQSLIEIYDLLQNIAADSWFARNWTFQEASCARDGMHLLVPYYLFLGQSTDPHSNPPRELALRLSELWNISSIILATIGRLKGTEPLRSSKNIDRMNHLCNLSWQWQHSQQSHLQSFDVAQQMQSRDNAVASDRLVIAANLCDYSKRLNTNSLRSLGYSYSICALVLALLNGTIAPFWATGFFLSVQAQLHSWRSDRVTEFLYRPAFFGGWSNPIGDEPRLADVKVMPLGVETSGWLWTVDKEVMLWNVKKKHRSQLDKIHRRAYEGTQNVSLVVQDIVADLLRELKKQNLSKLVDSVIACTTVQHSENDPRNEPDEIQFPLDTYHIGHWLLEIIKRILEHGRLWCGRLSDDEELSGIFLCEAPTAIFTSTDIATEHITRPLAMHNFVSFEVLSLSVSSEPVQKLSHTSKWTNGMWYAPQSSRRKCLFPWG